MKHRWAILLLVLGMALTLSASNLEANFIQCNWIATCEGTEFGDVMNGDEGKNDINGNGGDDFIFGAANPADACAVMSNEAPGGMMFGVSRCFFIFNPELLFGGPGNDFISGGPGSDVIQGDQDNDVLAPGPDEFPYGQLVNGNSGNDTIIVFAGEIASCLIADGADGNDSMNFIGYGPYSLVHPFGLPTGFNNGYIQVTDPITGGLTFIWVVENGDTGMETINGLPSANVTFVDILPDTPDCVRPIG